MTDNKRKWYFVVILLALLIAMPTLISQYFVLRGYQQKKSWPIIEATVVQTQIVGKRAILPLITYRYQVGGKTFIGKTDLQTPPFGLRNKRDITARAIIREHPVGSSLKIAYNPRNPQESTTGLHLPWNFYMKVAFSITLLMVSVFLLKKYLQK